MTMLLLTLVAVAGWGWVAAEACADRLQDAVNLGSLRAGSPGGAPAGPVRFKGGAEVCTEVTLLSAVCRHHPLPLCRPLQENFEHVPYRCSRSSAMQTDTSNRLRMQAEPAPAPACNTCNNVLRRNSRRSIIRTCGLAQQPARECSAVSPQPTRRRQVMRQALLQRARRPWRCCCRQTRLPAAAPTCWRTCHPAQAAPGACLHACVHGEDGAARGTHAFTHVPHGMRAGDAVRHWPLHRMA